MTYATFVVSLGSSPVQTVIDDWEWLEAHSQVHLLEPPLTVTLRVAVKATISDSFSKTASGDLLLVGGDLQLQKTNDAVPVLVVRTVCPAYKDQYLNQVVVVGNTAKKFRESEKSCSRGLCVNRFIGRNQQADDWYQIRGYGSYKAQLMRADSALIEVTGHLESRTNKENKSYLELKARTIRTLKKSHKQGGGPDPATQSQASGYEPQAYDGSDMPDFLN